MLVEQLSVPGPVVEKATELEPQQAAVVAQESIIQKQGRILDPEDLRPEERKWYPRAIQALRREGVPFLMAGAFGLYYHTGLWRGTKDMDLLVLPEHREYAIEAVCNAGLHDMFRKEPYDREWIFRSTRDGVIIDLIWQLANRASIIDQSWFDHADPGTFMGMPVQYVSAADMCWMKLFVFQAKRNDWPDILNVIRGTCGSLDWDHLLRRAGEHWRLLGALTEIFDWLQPQERQCIPDEFRARLQALRRQNADGDGDGREDMFDSRPWIAPAGGGFNLT